MTKLHLKENPTLKDYQVYIEQMVALRGFSDTSISEIMMLFLEESGEMAKAVRNKIKLQEDYTKKYDEDLGHEIADVFMYLLDIANNFNIDLEHAFREKEKLNSQRKWKTDRTK